MTSEGKWTVPRIRALKGRQRFACLTSYDHPTARLLDEAGYPLILVGDSLGMVVLGHSTTLPVTLDDMVRHTAAVARGVRRALVVADMPFMTYQVSVEEALRNAGRLLQEGGADAVKLEGAGPVVAVVRALVNSGIPVLGHVGLLPQHVRATGGYRMQGRSEEAADRIRRDAADLEEAGCFAIVLECIPADLAAEVTRSVSVPTIGIGAGPHCDGQILVVHDLLGLSESAPSFVRAYANLRQTMRDAFERFRCDVEEGRFP